jgi:hypothetical protein
VTVATATVLDTVYRRREGRGGEKGWEEGKKEKMEKNVRQGEEEKEWRGIETGEGRNVKTIRRQYNQ